MSGSSPSPVTASPSVLGGSRPSRSRQALIGAGSIVAVAGLLWLTSGGPAPEKEPTRPVQQETAGQVGSPYEAAPRPRAQQAAQRTGDPAPTTPAAPPVYVPAPLMVFGRDETTQRRGPPAPGDGQQAAAAAAAEPDPLSRRLQADDQATAVAYRMPDRNLFLEEGTPIACIPDAPITSDVEGAFRCKVPEGAGVFSASGNVPLLDAGTWISGRVGAGLRRGQRRLFVTFTKISTRDGCQVRIRAPGADALGQAGLDGEIDNHFFQRFGAYLGMAFVDAAMQGAVLAASNAVGRGGGVNFFQFQNAGRQGGRDLFAEDAAIPPTLYRNQAEPIVVRLTQDVDMRPCYRLRMKEVGR